MEVPSHTSRFVDFNSALGFNAAKDLPVDFDFAHFDIGVHHRVLTNNQDIIGGNRAVEITVNTKRADKFQLAGQTGFLV